jgi:hypothetical protein
VKNSLSSFFLPGSFVAILDHLRHHSKPPVQRRTGTISFDSPILESDSDFPAEPRFVKSTHET